MKGSEYFFADMLRLLTPDQCDLVKKMWFSQRAAGDDNFVNVETVDWTNFAAGVVHIRTNVDIWMTTTLADFIDVTVELNKPACQSAGIEPTVPNVMREMKRREKARERTYA